MLPQVGATCALEIEDEDDGDDDDEITPEARKKSCMKKPSKPAVAIAPAAQPREPPPKADIETLVWEHQREIQRLSQAVRMLEARAGGAGVPGPASSSTAHTARTGAGVNLGRADFFRPADVATTSSTTGAETPSPPSSFKRQNTMGDLSPSSSPNNSFNKKKDTESPPSSFKRQDTMGEPSGDASGSASPNSSFKKQLKRQNTAPMRQMKRSNSCVGFNAEHQVFEAAAKATREAPASNHQRPATHQSPPTSQHSPASPHPPGHCGHAVLA